MVDWYSYTSGHTTVLWSLTENILVAALYHFLFPSDSVRSLITITIFGLMYAIYCYHIIQSYWPFVIEPLYHKCSMFDVITVTYIQVQLSYCCLLSIRNLYTCFKFNLLHVFKSGPYEVFCKDTFSDKKDNMGHSYPLLILTYSSHSSLSR